MSFRRGRWVGILAVLCLVALPDINRAAEGDPRQEATPPEGEVGTRAMPTQKLGVERAPGVHMVPNLGAAVTPPPLYPPGCIKFNATGLQQPVPSTHYYATVPVMPDVIRTPSGSQGLIERGVVGSVIGVRENPNPSQFEFLGAPEIHLPHGAVIREFNVLVRDNSGKQNLQASIERYPGVGQAGGWRPVTLESDCLSLGADTRIGANNLAIPVDAKNVYRVLLGLVPANAPLPSPQTATSSADIITIGYTMP